MHFEFLVEGQAELTALSILMDRVLGNYGQPHTWKIHKHRGIGRIPDDPGAKPNKYDQTLLHNLPSKLRAYGVVVHPPGWGRGARGRPARRSAMAAAM